MLVILKWLAGHRKPLRRRKRPWLAGSAIYAFHRVRSSNGKHAVPA